MRGAAPIVAHSRRLRFVDDAQKILSRRRLAEIVAQLLAPQEPRNARERLHMRAGRGFGSDEEKQELDGTTVERIKLDRLSDDTGGHHELVEIGRLAVRDGYSAADAGAEQRLALADRGENGVAYRGIPVGRDEIHELQEHLVFR